MRNISASVILITAVLSSGYAFAQDTDEADMDETTMESSEDAGQDQRFKREPMDLAAFSNIDDIKAADADGDGSLSRTELEDYALKQVAKRMADRMERRLDINGDGTIDIAEIEKQKEKEFAALDRNEDGVIDRKEMRAGHKFGKHGSRGGHGFHHFRNN